MTRKASDFNNAVFFSEFVAEVDNVMFWKFLEKTSDIHTSNDEGEFEYLIFFFKFNYF